MIPFTNQHLAGYLPQFFDERDPRPAREQAHTAYAHGGGWSAFKGFTLNGGRESTFSLSYPGDPPMRELSRAQLRDELIVLFQSDWVAIIQPDNSYEIARMD